MSHELAFIDIPRDRTVDDAHACFMMDEDTFRAFYQRTARGLWAYLARITGDGHLADDLLQETFYRFLRAAATYENENHRRNSLYRIATNLARYVRCRTGRIVPLSTEDIAEASGGQDAAATE